MRAQRLIWTALPAAAMFLVGCSGTQSDSGSPDAAQSGAPSSSAGERVDVTETEFSIALSRTDFTPGTYTFAVRNDGRAPHDLAIKGPGVDDAKTPTVLRGGRTELTVTLQPGTYELWCTVGGHRAEGMELDLTVSD